LLIKEVGLVMLLVEDGSRGVEISIGAAGWGMVKLLMVSPRTVQSYALIRSREAIMLARWAIWESYSPSALALEVLGVLKIICAGKPSQRSRYDGFNSTQKR